jgi:hypothetical protein
MKNMEKSINNFENINKSLKKSVKGKYYIISLDQAKIFNEKHEKQFANTLELIVNLESN